MSTLLCGCFASSPPAPAVASVAGTTWHGVRNFRGGGADLDTLIFQPGGAMTSQLSTETTPSTGQWSQNGALIQFEVNNNYLQGEGMVSANQFVGTFSNKGNQSGTLSYTRAP